MYDYDILPSIMRKRRLLKKGQRENQCGERELLEEQDIPNELVERDLELSAEMRIRDIEIDKQVISEKGENVSMDETMRKTKQKVEVSMEEALLEEVQRKKQYEEPIRREKIIPNKELRRNIEIGRQTVKNARDIISVNSPTIVDSPGVKIKNVNTKTNIVSDIHETLNRLKDEVTKDQESTDLEKEEANKRANIARMYINKVKQEVEEENPSKRKMLYYLKKVGKVTSYVTEKVIDGSKLVTTFGEAFNTIQSLFGKK